jgi:hypothetical protein
MTTKKRPVKQQPLLTSVARTLGHAAGKLSRVTHELTHNLSALPDAVTAKLRQGEDVPPAAKKAQASAHHPKKRIRNARQSRTTKAIPASEKQTSAKNKSPRRKSERAGAKK